MPRTRNGPYSFVRNEGNSYWHRGIYVLTVRLFQSLVHSLTLSYSLISYCVQASTSRSSHRCSAATRWRDGGPRGFLPLDTPLR